MAQKSPDELFSTSWTLHRLSPLYHTSTNPPLLDTPDTLRQYSQRLHDALTGNLLGGIIQAVSATDSALDAALARAGALRECTWQNLPTWSYWNEEHSILEDPDDPSSSTLAVSAEQSVGILISLRYENVAYKAVLVAGPDGYQHQHQHQHQDRSQHGADAGDGTTYLPLLVTRMPNALRLELVSFLSTTFDARVSILRLSSGFICAALESYLATLARLATRPRPQLHRRGRGEDSSPTDDLHDDARRFIESFMKEVQLTVAFPPPIAPSLKSMDVLLPRDSLSEFYAHGLKEDASGSDGDGPSSIFLSTLARYFDSNLAMNLDVTDFKRDTTSGGDGRQQSYMRLSKVSCGAFVLGSEGRMKLMANPGRAIPLDDSEDEDYGEGDAGDMEEREKRLVWRANEGLLRALVARAMGSQGY